MGVMTLKIDDKTEKRMRDFVFKKYEGKGRHLAEEIAQAMNEYLDRHEGEVKG